MGKKILSLLVLLNIICLTKVLVGEEFEKIFLDYTLESNILAEKRPITICLPKDYGEGTTRYPTLYLLDGEQNLFHTAGICRYLREVGKIEGFIIVAIHSINRYRDYTPDKIEHHQGTGGAKQFTGFLTQELIPFIDKNFRTQTFRSIFGHSYSGSYVFHLLFNQPDFFNAYFAASPNLIILDKIEEQITSRIKQGFKNYKFLFTGFGKAEEDFLQRAKECKNIFSTLAPANCDWSLQILENDTHSSTPHRSIYNGLEMIFKEYWNFSNNISAERLKKNFDILSEKLGYPIKIPLLVLINCGNEALATNKLDQAESIFTLLIEKYPCSDWGYTGLGSVFYNQGKRKMARHNFKKALEINPHNSYAKDMLEALGKSKK